MTMSRGTRTPVNKRNIFS